MHTSSLPIALATLLCATSCVTQKVEVAGSVPLSGGGTRTLELRSFDPKDLRLRLWNRGPGVVTFRSFGVNGRMHTHGTLGDDEIRMQEVADLTAVELIADAQGAIVLYAIRGGGSVTMSVRDGAHPSSSGSPLHD